jgi:hypothetical protein
MTTDHRLEGRMANEKQVNYQLSNRTTFEYTIIVVYSHCDLFYPNPLSVVVSSITRRYYIPSHFTSGFMPLHFITFNPQSKLSHSYTSYNLSFRSRPLLPSRVPAQIDLVYEETPQSVKYREDDHGEKLEER